MNTRRRAFFKYEKRVRDLSAPDKVFQYFSTATTPEGTRYVMHCFGCCLHAAGCGLLANPARLLHHPCDHCYEFSLSSICSVYPCRARHPRDPPKAMLHKTPENLSILSACLVDVSDGPACSMMKPADLLCSLVAVYPPEDSSAVRSGALPGERRPSSGQGDPANQACTCHSPEPLAC